MVHLSTEEKFKAIKSYFVKLDMPDWLYDKISSVLEYGESWDKILEEIVLTQGEKQVFEEDILKLIGISKIIEPFCSKVNNEFKKVVGRLFSLFSSVQTDRFFKIGKTQPFFMIFGKADILFFENFLKSASIVFWNKNEKLLCPEAIPDAIYFILKGAACAVSTDTDVDKSVTVQLQEGDYWGYLSPFTRSERSIFLITSQEDVVTLKVQKEEMHNLFKDFPSIRENLLEAKDILKKELFGNHPDFDLREHKRHSIHLAAKILVLEHENKFSQKKWDATILDLSKGGVKLEIKNYRGNALPLEKKRVLLEISDYPHAEISLFGRTLSCKAEIKSGNVTLGVKFEPLTHEQNRELERLLTSEAADQKYFWNIWDSLFPKSQEL